MCILQKAIKIQSMMNFKSHKIIFMYFTPMDERRKKREREREVYLYTFIVC